MSTFQERAEKTRQFVMQEQIGVLEGLQHLYFWMRFEVAIVKRNSYALKAEKYARRLNTNIDVYQFRKELDQTNL